MSDSGSKGTLISPGDPGASPGDAESSVPGSRAVSFTGNGSRLGGHLQSGEILAGRFRVRELVQSGGMGDVYSADDMVGRCQVAIKTLRQGAASLERFEREAVRLSELRHPSIPRYITHDLASAGMPFLAMEWLEGVDLAVHMRRGRVGLKSAVGIVRAAAEGVAAAHALGIVHRDINPSNLFLVADQELTVRVLDFGVARLEEGDLPLTAEGAQIGTPGYMAPEQIEAQGEVGPRADVFSLGCVLYEATTGTRAFHAPTIRELLVQMVAEDPPSPRALNPAIPRELDRLIMLLLTKDAEARPADAAELVALLDDLPPLDDSVAHEAIPSQPGSTEQHVTSLIVLRADTEGAFEKAIRAAEPHGMRARRGEENTIVIATGGAGTAGDHATRAARCALAIQRATRAHQMALSTGLSQQAGEALSGRAFDSAMVALLLKEGVPSADLPQGPCLWLDENTASLLDSRFEVRGVEQGYLLKGLRETYEPTRTVLGRKTRCVGRKRELSMLEATLNESFEDRVASTVLITGPPGIGKSRLAAEITRTARRLVPGVQIFRGGAEPLNSGSPFGALTQAIERACRMRDAEPNSVRRTKLHERLRPLFSEQDFNRVGEFLGELLAIASDRQPSPQLEAARRDAVLKGDQILRALEDWIRAECEARPMLLILDDFHWGDLPTVKLLDSALRNLAELPLVVLTLARPEVHESFPKLWVKRGVTELRLSGLSRRAATEMIEEVLGPSVSKSVLDRIITRAQGNPFWIEELLRAEDAGQGENVPDRVVLLAQSRIEQQSLDERRLLLGASVFGRQFWLGGAAAVLGPESSNLLIDTVLTELVENEFIVEHPLSRIGGEREYQFASGLLRDAAYSLLAEEEREQGHLRAAGWLERNGDSDPLAVAMHFTLGGEPDRAKPHYLAAAEQALAGDDLDAALSCAEEGLSAGARGRDAVRLRLVQAEASKWQGNNAQAFKAAQAGFARAEEGTVEWFRAAAESAVAAGKTGKKQSCLAIAKELLESSPHDDALADYGIALSRVATQLVFSGNKELAGQMLEAVRGAAGEFEPDPHVMGFWNEARAVLAGASEDPLGRITYAEQAVEHFEDAGDLRNACLGRLSQGFAEVEFGAIEDAIVTMTRAREVAERMGLANSVPVARAQLGRALGRLGRFEEAALHLEAAAHSFDRQKNIRLSGMSRVYLAELHLLSGQPEAALECAQRAAAILEPMAPMRRIALAMLAAISALPVVGVPDEDTEAWARGALEGLGPDDRLPVGESLVRLGAASGLHAAGHLEEAANVHLAERARVSVQIATMPDRRAKEFLSGDPARRLLTIDSTELASEADRFNYAASLMNTSINDGVESTDKTREATTLEEVERIIAEPEPVLRNLWITQSYHELSNEIGRVVDQQNVNWSTFACWASKTAGISIRNEEVPNFVRDELGLSDGQLVGLGGVSQKLVSLFGFGRLVRDTAIETLLDVSQEIALGNRKVYAELAPLFARFVDVMKRDPREDTIERFIENLEPGPIEKGGQELLKRAFRCWFDASKSESEGARAQLILRGNCLIGLHEQTRLQPHIKDAMDAPVETLWQQKLRGFLPVIVGLPIALVLKFLTRPFLGRITRLWEKMATRYAMNLSLPSGQEISLGEDLPQRPDTFPPDLQTITDPKTEALLARFDSELQSTVGSGANNWADLNDRMGFIVELFRSRQQDLLLMGPPFNEDQQRALSAGKIPEGSL